MRRLLLVVTALALVTAACTPTRPGTEEWSGRWEAAVATLPTRPEAGAAVDPATCERVLAELRLQRNNLLPSPDDRLDETVDQWFRLAEEIFFECPIRLGPYAGWDAGYDELSRLQAAVEAFLSAG